MTQIELALPSLFLSCFVYHTVEGCTISFAAQEEYCLRSAPRLKALFYAEFL